MFDPKIQAAARDSMLLIRKAVEFGADCAGCTANGCIMGAALFRDGTIAHADGYGEGDVVAYPDRCPYCDCTGPSPSVDGWRHRDAVNLVNEGTRATFQGALLRWHIARIRKSAGCDRETAERIYALIGTS